MRRSASLFVFLLLAAVSCAAPSTVPASATPSMPLPAATPGVLLSEPAPVTASAVPHSVPTPIVRRTPAPGLSSADRFVCTVDDECTNSCSLGAVNRQWLDATLTVDCEDGCADVDAGPPRCEQGSCVAYLNGRFRSAARRDECTRRPTDELVKRRPGK